MARAPRLPKWASVSVSPGTRMGPQDRDVIDWLAHGFGRAADFARGQKKSITAIEREEASNRLIRERRQRRERVEGWASSRKKGAKVRGA